MLLVSNRQDLKTVNVTIKESIERWQIFNFIRRIGLQYIIDIL
jgi:hypothetical protein